MPKCPNITQRINIMCTKVQEFFEKHSNLINRNNPKVQLSPIFMPPFSQKGSMLFRKRVRAFSLKGVCFFEQVR